MELKKLLATAVGSFDHCRKDLQPVSAWDEDMFPDMPAPWPRLLTSTSLIACIALRSAMLDPRSSLVLLLLQIGHSMLQGLSCSYVQGVAGAGKTYLNALVAIFLVELCDIRVLWTGEMNPPQLEGAKE